MAEKAEGLPAAPAQPEAYEQAALRELVGYVFGGSSPEQVARHSPNAAKVLRRHRAVNGNRGVDEYGFPIKPPAPKIGPALTNRVLDGVDLPGESRAMRQKRVERERREQKRGVLAKAAKS